VPAPLTKEQNRRVQEAAKQLIALHKGNASEAARAIHKEQSWLNRIASGKLGASLQSASVIFAALGMDVSSSLGIAQSVVTWQDLPGFDAALAEARAKLHNMYDERIWHQIGRMSMPPHPAVVEPWMLIQLAPFVSALNANPVPLIPDPGGGSVRRLKSARRG